MISHDMRSSLHSAEVRYYFPEWAERPAGQGPPLESANNSYLAGGYAEEFGYAIQLGSPPAPTNIAGDPERSSQWLVQIAGLHPGYPECPRPLDRCARDCEAHIEAAETQSSAQAAYQAGWASHRLPVDFAVVRVGGHGRTRRHGGLFVALTLLWNELRMRRRGLGGGF
jgi:hypothetical protein